MDEDGAEADADGGEFLGGVVGAVVHIDGLGHAAFVEGGLEGVDEAGGVVGRVKGAVGDDAGGVVDEADEIGLDGFAAQAGVQIGAVEGVGLPEVVGVGFGKGEAGFGAVVAEGFEEVELFDDATEGVGGDLFAADEAAGPGASAALEVPVADNRIDAPTMDAPRSAQGDEEAEALHAAWCRAAGELHGASVACPANPGRPADSAFSALSQVGCLN